VDEQEYIFDLGGCSVDEVCAVIQSYVDTNEGEVSCNFGTPNSHYAKIEFSLSSGWHGFPSFDQLISYNEQEQYSTMTLLTLHGKTTLRITPVVGDWLVFKPHVDKIIAHLLPTSGESVTRQLWRLKGTIDELKAELKSSHVAHRPIGPDGPAYYKIDIGNYEPKQRQPTISMPTFDSYTFFPRGVQDRPRGAPVQRPVKEVPIEFVQEGDRLRMTVTIDDDVTPDLYADIHERWAMLREHLAKHRGLVPYGQTIEKIAAPLAEPLESDQTDTQMQADRKLDGLTCYRCTLVRNRVAAQKEKYTSARRSISLDDGSYKECEKQNKFLTNPEMYFYLKDKTEDEAWQKEVNDHNGL